MRLPKTLTAAVLVLTLLAVACSSDSGPAPSDVVGTIPWKSTESTSYLLKNKKGDLLGRGTLGVEVSGASTKLSQRFQSDTSRDESTVIVESQTLKPVSAMRTIVTRSDEETVEVTYSEVGALIKQGVKQSGLSVPEHAYDNDSSLFLWRTLPFREGYEASYVTIITNRRERQTVRLTVKGRETVRVAAGEMQVWRLEVKTSNATQIAWYADTPSRTLVKYDNDRGLIFELETP